jgi:hypothetical protein
MKPSKEQAPGYHDDAQEVSVLPGGGAAFGGPIRIG